MILPQLRYLILSNQHFLEWKSPALRQLPVSDSGVNLCCMPTDIVREAFAPMTTMMNLASTSMWAAFV